MSEQPLRNNETPAPDKSACAKCGHDDNVHHPDYRECICGGCDAFTPAPDKSAGLTREEYEAYVWHMDGIESDTAKLLDHDAALRAEVEHNQNTIESLILQRDKAEAERDKARSDFASARALMCAPWNADTYLKLWTAEAQRDALLKAMRKIHGHDGTLICDVRCRIAAAAIKEASHE